MARLTRAGWQKALACPGMWLGASQAIDACANGTSFATDQRGFLRPVGAFPDLGAVESVYDPAGPAL